MQSLSAGIPGLTIGGHAGGGRKIGEVDFGPAAAEFDEDEVTLKWYDYLFKGAQNEFAGKPVKIFVMGANQWREEDDWPLARAQSTKYFLHSVKGAASLRGDGILSTVAPRSEAADHYLCDSGESRPHGRRSVAAIQSTCLPGPRDQRAVEARDDVLIYTTPGFRAGHGSHGSGQP